MGIFLFRHKNEKEAQDEIFRRKVDERLLKLLDETAGQKAFLETLSQDIRQNGADIRRHDMALEDCLEMLEEQQAEESQAMKQIRMLDGEQERLLQLLEVYQEQMWNMKRYAAEHDPAWVSQLELAQNTVRGKQIPCGISLIEEAGVKVDYELHEVIQVRDTMEKEKAQTVAEIYHPGYIYKGKVKRKAKVSAYRLM